MPDIQIRVNVVGSDKSISDLKSVGSAAQSAGKSATAGSGGILKWAGSAAGAATGAMALTNGLFGIQDAMDNVEREDNTLAKAHKKMEVADKALAKAQDAVKKEFQDTTKTVRDNNGAVGTQTEHILSYNAATGEAIVQTKTSNGEMKISTKNIKENSLAFQQLDIATEGSKIAHENYRLELIEDKKVHERLIPTIAGEALQMTLGALAIAPFVQQLIKMATGGKGAASAIKDVGNAAGGAGSTICAQVDCTEKAAGAVGQLGAQAVRSAIPIKAFTAGVAIVGGGAGAMATNFLGARDAIGGTANAIQNADKNLKPLGLTIEGLMQKARILPDPFNKANQEIGTGTQGISRQLLQMGQVGSQGITFITRGFQQFSTQIASGNIGGAINTAISGITTGLDKLKNINFPSVVTIDWSIKNIWPALSTIYADLKATWGVLTAPYNATIDWLVTHVWPTVQDAFAKLREKWSNVVISYNAVVNWAVTHVWPIIQDAYAKLRQTWSNVVVSYNATINWLVTHVWPIVQDAFAKLRQTWGNVVAAYNATINWLVIHVWPTIQEAYAKLRQVWGNVVAAYNATINWAVVHNWPPLANAYAKLREIWGNVLTSYNATVNWLVVHNWPPLADAYAKLRQIWGNVLTSYNATINWAVVHNWPPLADAYAKLRQTWSNVSITYNAVVNWSISYKWPTLIDIAIDFGKVFSGASLPAAIAIDLSKSTFTWPDIGKAITEWASKIQMPNLDTVWSKIDAAIKAPAPRVAASIWAALGLASGGTVIIPPEQEQKILDFVNQYQASQKASQAVPSTAGTPTAISAYTMYQQQQAQKAAPIGGAASQAQFGKTGGSTAAPIGGAASQAQFGTTGAPGAPKTYTAGGTSVTPPIYSSSQATNVAPIYSSGGAGGGAPGGQAGAGGGPGGGAFATTQGASTAVGGSFTPTSGGAGTGGGGGAGATSGTGSSSPTGFGTSGGYSSGATAASGPSGGSFGGATGGLSTGGGYSSGATSGAGSMGGGYSSSSTGGGGVGGVSLAKGGSAVINRPVSFGSNLSLGGAFDPQLITLIPLANAGGAAILNVTSLGGSNRRHRGGRARGFGFRSSWLGGNSVPLGAYGYGAGGLINSDVKYGAQAGGSFVVRKPTTFGNVTVGEGYKPELLTFIPFKGSVGGGILNVIPLTRKPRGNAGGRHFATGGNAIVGDLSSGIAKSVINVGVQINSRDAESKVSNLKNKLDTSLPETRKTTITAEAQGFEGAINTIKSQLSTIPKDSRSTVSADASAAIFGVNSFKSILSSIPATKTVTLTTISQPITHAQHGFGPGIVRKPTLFMAGENGPELVHVQPMGHSSKGGISGLMRRARAAADVAHGGENYDYNKLMAVVQKLIMVWSTREQNMNLIVDGKRMVTSVQKYLGSQSYGDR